MAIKFSTSTRLKIVFGIVGALILYFTLITLLIYFEKDSKQASIIDYPNAVWYSLVTLTTVGYGDLVPATVFGRAIGFVFIMASIGVYGIFIGQITTLMATIKEEKHLGHNGTTMINHAVIIGWNEFGKMVLDQLISVGKQVAIVTNLRDDVDFIREKYTSKNVFILFSELDNHEFLKKAGIDSSSIVFVNLQNDTEKLVYILNMKKIYPKLEYVVTLDNGDLKNTFLAAGVTNTISKFEIASKLLASYMFEPDVATYSEDIMSVAKEDIDYDMKQFMVTDTNPYVGKAYQDVFFDLKTKYNGVLIGITKRDKYGNKRLLKNPLGDLRISVGDYLIIILNRKAFKLIRNIFGVDEGYRSAND
ncbi:MAG: potassium channel family protein [Bacteroidota bacterium]